MMMKKNNREKQLASRTRRYGLTRPEVCLLIAFVLVVSKLALAQPGTRCATEPHRQLDFWIGEWNVFNAQQEQVARSQIESIISGCGLSEKYQADSGYSGTSLNQFDEDGNQWQQFWLDSNGESIHFNGHFNDNTMTFDAYGFEDQRGSYIRRMRLISISADEVQQESDRSYDQGNTWCSEYRLTYRRRQ